MHDQSNPAGKTLHRNKYTKKKKFVQTMSNDILDPIDKKKYNNNNKKEKKKD